MDEGIARDGSSGPRPPTEEARAHRSPATNAREPAYQRARPLLIDPLAIWLLVSLIVGGALLWGLRDLIAPLLFAAALAFIGAPVVNRLARRGVPRYLGSALFLILVGMILAALLLLVLPQLVSQLGDLFERVPEILRRVERFLVENLGIRAARNLGELADSLRSGMVEGARGLAGGAARGIASVVSITALVVLVPLLTFFTLAELPALSHFVYEVIPARWRAETTRYGRLTQGALANMLRGQLIVASIMAAIYVVGLSIVGVPLPVAIGILSGFAYFIPFATTPVCIGLSTIFVLLEPGGRVLFPILGATLIALGVQGLESWLLTPRIVGSKAKLSPVVVVFAVVIGGELFGFTGILFSFPVATAIGVVVRDRYAHVLESGTQEEEGIGAPPGA